MCPICIDTLKVYYVVKQNESCTDASTPIFREFDLLIVTFMMILKNIILFKMYFYSPERTNDKGDFFI